MNDAQRFQMIWNRRVEYWAIRSSVHSFARSLTHSLRSSWERGFCLLNERVDFISFETTVCSACNEWVPSGAPHERLENITPQSFRKNQTHYAFFFSVEKSKREKQVCCWLNSAPGSKRGDQHKEKFMVSGKGQDKRLFFVFACVYFRYACTM